MLKDLDSSMSLYPPPNSTIAKTGYISQHHISTQQNQLYMLIYLFPADTAISDIKRKMQTICLKSLIALLTLQI